MGLIIVAAILALDGFTAWAQEKAEKRLQGFRIRRKCAFASVRAGSCTSSVGVK
jgi:hypothetical protein